MPKCGNCKQPIKPGEFHTQDAEPLCISCFIHDTGMLPNGTPVAEIASTTTLRQELEKREMDDVNAIIRGANVRADMIFEMIPMLLEAVPEHDKPGILGCTDEQPGNWGVRGTGDLPNRAKCRRCTLIHAQQVGRWAVDENLQIGIVRDEQIAGLLKKVVSKNG